MKPDDITQARNSISIIKDPFAQENMIAFRAYANKSFTGEWNYYGSIEFQNDSTKGEQKFKANNYHELLLKMETFVKEELEK